MDDAQACGRGPLVSVQHSPPPRPPAHTQMRQQHQQQSPQSPQYQPAPSPPSPPIADPIEAVRFMFAVGIECSCPRIEGGRRVDQLRDTGHYDMWRTDLKLVRELGLRYLRYGPPIYRIFLGPDQYDWSFLDPVMAEMKRLGIVPIIDLL